jgi:DNA-binding NarL/FixJ family response regulator
VAGRSERIRGPGSLNRARLDVVIVDAPSVICIGLSLIIRQQSDMSLAGLSESADEGLAFVKSLKRRTSMVVMVGLAIPGEHDALWLIRQLREQFPSVRVLSCGIRGDAASVSRALLAGADGYLDEEAKADRFVDAIRACSRGGTVLEGLPENALGAIADAIDRQANSPRLVTERERMVLALAAEGLTARQIATRLGLRERTVTTHLDHIYRKLGVSGRIAAINEGARLGLVAVG